jgi:hypothetical protein
VRVRGLVPALVLAPALFAGCILSPGQDDLSDVCESHAGSPGPAYTLDGIAQFTNAGDANLTPEHTRALLAAVQPDVITKGAHAHANFSAWLNATADGWRFEAQGRAANGTLVDTYAFDLAQEKSGVSLAALRPTVEPVPAPESLVAEAWGYANATPDLARMANATPTLVATGWNPIIPTCIHLLFQNGPADAILPASKEHPHTDVVVSLTSDRVVFFKRDGWT